MYLFNSTVIHQHGFSEKFSKFGIAWISQGTLFLKPDCTAIYKTLLFLFSLYRFFVQWLFPVKMSIFHGNFRSIYI